MAMVSDLTHRPPIKVINRKEVACFTEECTGNVGISTSGGHKEKRDHCIREMRKFFGFIPLIPSVFYGDFYGNISANQEQCAGFMKGQED